MEGEEQVQTQAGTFRAIKVKITGGWWLSLERGGGMFDETLWYAPAVKRFVKDEYQERSRWPGGAAVTTETELVRYSVRPLH